MPLIIKYDVSEICQLHEVLTEFAEIIRKSFELYKIKEYFDSNPRFGTLGHVATEEEHDDFIAHGTVERSSETEIENALIRGEIMLYFWFEGRVGLG